MDPWKSPAPAELGEAENSPFIGEIGESSDATWPTEAAQRWSDFESPFVATMERSQGLEAELAMQVEEVDPLEEDESTRWLGTPEQIAFRDRVLQAHTEASRKRKGAPIADLADTDQAPVTGTGICMGRDAAAAAERLLSAARAALAEAQRTGHADALKTVGIGASSGYRNRAHQERLWKGYFDGSMRKPKGYYDETAAVRATLPGGEHGDAAVRYMLRTFRIPDRIAAPGYSNHQAGLAIDLLQKRVKGERVFNSTGKRSVQKWESTWLFEWLLANASAFGFERYRKEPWHWTYRSANAESTDGDWTYEEAVGQPHWQPHPSTFEAPASDADLDSESRDDESEAGLRGDDEAEEQVDEADDEAEGQDGDEAGLLGDLADDTAHEMPQLMLIEAALRGELLLDPQTPAPSVAAPPAWGEESLVGEGPEGQLPEEQQAAPVAVTRVDVSVRTDFTVCAATGISFDWARGEAVRGARAQIVGTAVRAESDARGNLRLDTTGLRDGFYTICIEHTIPEQSSPDIAGPTVADPLTTPPRRIYRPLNVWVRMRGGQITGAMVALFSTHGGIGNRSRTTFDATHLPIDWKPVWMRSPMKATERPRATTTIDLVVVHSPVRHHIGPAINTFQDATEVGNAHYLIDHNGHVIKMAEDRRRANHTGFSRWCGNGQLNVASIGIEVMHAPDGFTPMAMANLAALIERLRAAYPTIPAHRVVGHSDIATTSRAQPTLLSDRRRDPGHDFDWHLLEQRGLGMVPGPVAVGVAYSGIFVPGQPALVLRNGDRDRHGTTPARLGGIIRADVTGAPIAELQADLEHIGYSVRPPGGNVGRFDAHTVAAVDKFQRHFFSGSRESLRPTLGRVDVLTAGWIRAVRSTIP